jgi:hypothetical protein
MYINLFVMLMLRYHACELEYCYVFTSTASLTAYAAAVGISMLSCWLIQQHYCCIIDRCTAVQSECTSCFNTVLRAVCACTVCCCCSVYCCTTCTHTTHRHVKLVIADTPGSEPASASTSVSQQQQGHAIRAAVHKFEQCFSNRLAGNDPGDKQCALFTQLRDATLLNVVVCCAPHFDHTYMKHNMTVLGVIGQLTGRAVPATVTKSSYKGSCLRSDCYGLSAVREDTELSTVVKLDLRGTSTAVDDDDHAALLLNRDAEIDRLTSDVSEKTVMINELSAEALVYKANIADLMSVNSVLKDTVSTLQANQTAQLQEHNQTLTARIQAFEALQQHNVALQSELNDAKQLYATAAIDSASAAAERKQLLVHIDELKQDLSLAKAALDNSTTATVSATNTTKVPSLEVCTQVRLI